MVGIQPRAVARNAVVLATALCGLAGAALAPIQLVTPMMGHFLIFKAFALIIIGGLGNIPGTIAAAVGLGLMESWIGGFFEIVWQDAAVRRDLGAKARRWVLDHHSWQAAARAAAAGLEESIREATR